MGKKLLKYFFIGLFIIILEILSGVGSNLVAGSQPVKEFIHKLEVYSGVNILEKKPLITDFTSQKHTYKMFEDIKFKLKLKSDAFVYLLNISDQDTSLVFPNASDQKNQYKKSKTYNIPSQDYNIHANKKSTEQFYLVASETKLSFHDFAILSNAKAKERIEDLKKSCLVDVFRLDVRVD